MEMKQLVWVGIFVGSTIGGYIPTLWGDDFFSMSSILLSGLGAFVGIFAAYQISQR